MVESLQMLSKNEIKKIKSLHQKKYRDVENKFFIEGIHLIEEALKSEFRLELVLFTSEFEETNNKFLSEILAKKIRIEKITNKEFDGICDTENSQGIFSVMDKFENTFENYLKRTKALKKQTLVALEEISDPGNLGTIIRTADWFGIDAILIGKNSVDLFNPKVIRATMGSIFHLPIFNEIDLPEILPEIKDQEYSIYVTLLHGESYISTKFGHKSLLIFGNEAHGISNEIIKMAYKTISIPQHGKAESLNVSIAAGVILSEIAKQNKK
jgi:RNA methyltransferase, TrmH family